MTSCGLTIEGAPVLHVQLIGRGEDAMRMDKRLSCAGRALGVNIQVDWHTTRHGDPLVLIDGQPLVDHLVDTPQLEGLLRPFAQALLQEGQL